MAWAEQLPSGRWRGFYRDRASKRRYLPDTYSQGAEAKREAAKKEDEIRRRPEWRKNAGKLTWGQWADEWWPKRDVEPSTARNDASVIRQHIRPRWGDEQLADISQDLVQDWVDGLAETPATKSTSARGEGGQRFTETGKPLSAATVAKTYRVFSSSMKAALVAGRIYATPCVGIVLPKPDPLEEHFLTRDEFARLLDAAGEDELLAIVLRLGVGTGLRWGELVGLHRNRVDLDQQRIIVQEVYDQTNGEIKPYPKGHRRRGVPMTAELAVALREWMARPALPCATPHRDGKRCTGSLLVPTPETGTALVYSNFRRDRFDSAVTAAGVECTPHSMRHTYASWLVQDGVRIEVVSELLGHQDIKTTQRYKHLADTQWEQVRDILASRAPQAAEVSEDSLRERLSELAQDRPEWAAALAALDGSESVTGRNGKKFATHLPHVDQGEEGGKIVQLDRWRRSGA